MSDSCKHPTHAVITIVALIALLLPLLHPPSPTRIGAQLQDFHFALLFGHREGQRRSGCLLLRMFGKRRAYSGEGEQEAVAASIRWALRAKISCAMRALCVG